MDLTMKTINTIRVTADIASGVSNSDNITTIGNNTGEYLFVKEAAKWKNEYAL